MDCGLMQSGQCTLAGTEFCDWDCGRLDRQRLRSPRLTKLTCNVKPEVKLKGSIVTLPAHARQPAKE